MVKLDCYYSLSSPWAYLAGPKLQGVVRRHRPRLTLKPFDFQAVVPKAGGVPIRIRPEPRRRYHEAELTAGARLGSRWRARHYPEDAGRS
jgi:2-hydroxychromene-2-carboxylate isomerase